MKTTADFLDDLRARHGITSDSKLAIFLGWKRSQLGRYRAKRESFSDETCHKIAAQLGIAPDYIMACMAWQRAKSPEIRSAWERIAAKVAACVVCGVVSGAPAPAPAAGGLHNSFCGQSQGENTHMRQTRRRRQGPAFARKRALPRLSSWRRTLGSSPEPGGPPALIPAGLLPFAPQVTNPGPL